MLNQNVFLSAEVLNILTMLNVLEKLEKDLRRETCNIFNISAKRNTFSEKRRFSIAMSDIC